MSRVLMVSRDAMGALAMASRTNGVTHVVLLDAAAGVARMGHPLASRLREVLDGGVVVAVHDDAVARRGITAADLAPAVKAVDLDEIADLVVDAPGGVVWL